MTTVHLSFAPDAWRAEPSEDGWRLRNPAGTIEISEADGRLRVAFASETLTVSEGGLSPVRFSTTLHDGAPPPGAPIPALPAALWIAERAIGATAGRVCQALRALAEAWAARTETRVEIEILGHRGGRRARRKPRWGETATASGLKPLRLLVLARINGSDTTLADSLLPDDVSTAIRRVARLPQDEDGRQGGFPTGALATVCAKPPESAHQRLDRRAAALAALEATGMGWPTHLLP